MHTKAGKCVRLTNPTHKKSTLQKSARNKTTKSTSNRTAHNKELSAMLATEYILIDISLAYESKEF
jgi:hypothetical protein